MTLAGDQLTAMVKHPHFGGGTAPFTSLHVLARLNKWICAQKPSTNVTVSPSGARAVRTELTVMSNPIDLPQKTMSPSAIEAGAHR